MFGSLQNNYKILTKTQKEQLLKELFETFPLTNWGRINRDKLNTVKKCMYTDNFIDSIIAFIGGNNEDIIIVWDEINHPVITSKLSSILNVIDDVTAVSFNTWIFSKDKKKIVEFYHDGEIILGVING